MQNRLLNRMLNDGFNMNTINAFEAIINGHDYVASESPATAVSYLTELRNTIDSTIKGIEAEVLKKMQEGQMVDGYEINYRSGRSAIPEPERLAHRLIKEGFGEDIYHEPKLKSMTELRKKFRRNEFATNILQEEIVRAPAVQVLIRTTGI